MEISLTETSGGISGYLKSGPDLEISFQDGQALNIENFFVSGPDGEFSSLVDDDGTTLVSGLLAPEPDAESLGLAGAVNDIPDATSAESTGISELDLASGSALSFAESMAGEPEIDPGPTWPLGLGIASGLGGLSLLSDASGSDSGSASDQPNETSSASVTSATIGDDEIADLLGPSSGDAALDDELAELLQPAATASEGDTDTALPDATEGLVPVDDIHLDMGADLVAVASVPELLQNDPIESEL
ncbi:hypothetical protein IQ782_24920 [Salipiger pacificus]|uniref:BapA prefix-like domain-containing protein n=2 Tax=Salipiger mangrovisoli TaxID=2865933 RepID=A0ABR9X9H0_9RHOB|nr:hypothetical protein [Salipiger mangrovisoli]